MNLRAYRAWLSELNFISVPPPTPHPWMQNQTYKNERVFRNNAFTSKFCWDILFYVHEKPEHKVEKDEKNLFVCRKVLANNISQSAASIF